MNSGDEADSMPGVHMKTHEAEVGLTGLGLMPRESPDFSPGRRSKNIGVRNTHSRWLDLLHFIDDQVQIVHSQVDFCLRFVQCDKCSQGPQPLPSVWCVFEGVEAFTQVAFSLLVMLQRKFRCAEQPVSRGTIPCVWGIPELPQCF